MAALVIMEDRMKTLMLCACMVGAAIAIAAQAASATVRLDWNGHLRDRPKSYVGFDLQRRWSGERKVAFFTSKGLPFRCDNGSTGKTGFLTLDNSLPINRGEIDGESHASTPQGDPIARVHGALDTDHARGSLSVSGSLDPKHPSVSCRTGRHGWVADRTFRPGAPVD
jgi:hypothetical protein